MPTAGYIICGSQYKMKMLGFLFKEQGKVPKSMKYKTLYLLQFLSNSLSVFSLFAERRQTFRGITGALCCSSVHVWVWPSSYQGSFLTRHETNVLCPEWGQVSQFPFPISLFPKPQ